MTLEALTARLAEAIIFVPAPITDSLASMWAVGPYREPVYARRVTIAKLVAELEPKLPEIGSVWMSNKGVGVRIAWFGGGLITTQGFDEIGKKKWMHAEWFEWVRETGAVCVYSPSKEPCQHERIEYTPDPSGNNDVLWKCPDCKREWDRDPRRKPDAVA